MFSSGYKPLKPLFYVDSDKLSDEQRYWNRLKEVSVFQETGNITSTEFLPVHPHHVATTYNNSISLYDTNSCVPIAHYTKIKTPIKCAVFRADGQILAAGAHDGLVRLVRVAAGKRADKCTLHSIQNFPKAHSHAVNSVAFAPPAGVMFATVAHNGAVRAWDVSDSRGVDAAPLWKVDGAHADQARCAVFGTRNTNILVTGGYDHKVKVWDVRAAIAAENRDGVAAPTLQIDHGAPVERVLLFPNETIVASAGGSTVKLWDVAAGGKLLHTMHNHLKTVTSLCFATNRTCLLSAGLDRRINLFRCDSGDFSLVKSWKVAAPVLSLAMSADDKRMAFGMSNLLTIYRRKTEKELCDAQRAASLAAAAASSDALSDAKSARKRERHRPAPLIIDAAAAQHKDESRSNAGAPSVLQRQRADVGLRMTMVALMTRRPDKRKLSQLDRALRDRRYREFFSLAVSRCGLEANRPEYTVAALHQLCIHQKVALALSGHPESVLRDFIHFLELNLFKAPFFNVLYDVFNAFLKVYSSERLSAKTIDAIDRLKAAIFEEIAVERELAKCLGVVSMIAYRARTDAVRNAQLRHAESDDDDNDDEEEEEEVGKREKEIQVNAGGATTKSDDDEEKEEADENAMDVDGETGDGRATDEEKTAKVARSSRRRNRKKKKKSDVDEATAADAPPPLVHNDIVIVDAKRTRLTARSVVWDF